MKISDTAYVIDVEANVVVMPGGNPVKIIEAHVKTERIPERDPWRPIYDDLVAGRFGTFTVSAKLDFSAKVDVRTIDLSSQAKEFLGEIDSYDPMLQPEKLVAAAELVKAGICFCYKGQDGELYLKRASAK